MPQNPAVRHNKQAGTDGTYCRGETDCGISVSAYHSSHRVTLKHSQSLSTNGPSAPVHGAPDSVPACEMHACCTAKAVWPGKHCPDHRPTAQLGTAPTSQLCATCCVTPSRPAQARLPAKVRTPKLPGKAATRLPTASQNQRLVSGMLTPLKGDSEEQCMSTYVGFRGTSQLPLLYKQRHTHLSLALPTRAVLAAGQTTLQQAKPNRLRLGTTPPQWHLHNRSAHSRTQIFADASPKQDTYSPGSVLQRHGSGLRLVRTVPTHLWYDTWPAPARPSTVVLWCRTAAQRAPCPSPYHHHSDRGHD